MKHIKHALRRLINFPIIRICVHICSFGFQRDLGATLRAACRGTASVGFELPQTEQRTAKGTVRTRGQEGIGRRGNLMVLRRHVSKYKTTNRLAYFRPRRPACQSNLFAAWETLLQEIEADSQATIDVASTLSRQVSTGRVGGGSCPVWQSVCPAGAVPSINHTLSNDSNNCRGLHYWCVNIVFIRPCVLVTEVNENVLQVINQTVSLWLEGKLIYHRFPAQFIRPMAFRPYEEVEQSEKLRI